jgi:ribosomal protein S12 methylthiotransferase
MKFKIVSLGCPKNLVESEFIAHRLEAGGHEMSDDCDTVVINTCAFIADAARESIETILEEAQPGGGGGKRLIVTGCLVERYGDKLRELLPEAGLFVGRSSYGKMESLVGREGIYGAGGRFDATFPRKTLTRLPSTYLKIQEGCDNRCSYCTIPSIRGPLQSREPGDILKEFTWLLDEGFKEINIIGQDITAFGRGTGSSLDELLRLLLSVKREFFLRLLYLHPKGLKTSLIDLVAAEDRIIPYLDIPIQHSEDSILRAMNRGYGRKDLESMLAGIRASMPGAVLRTSVIVGFPGESEEDFHNLCRFIETWQFDNLGAFMYSREEGTPANRLKGHIRKPVKRSRHAAVMEIQKAISRKKLKGRVGEETKVVIEEKGEEYMVGRIFSQAPDIDGVAFVKGDCTVGEIRVGKIVKTLDYDVIVEV